MRRWFISSDEAKTQLTYQKRLERHLTDYKTKRLGIQACGTFTYRGYERTYGHILPRQMKWLNVPEVFRREICDYVTTSKIPLHKYFHHLNSSQAFGLALFHPYLNVACGALEKSLGTSPIRQWNFEYVPDQAEGTNVDVWWRSNDDTESFCEIKLSEKEFGPTVNDARHVRKLIETYGPALEGLVGGRLLEQRVFFKNYQILRNLWLAARKGHENDWVLFLIPEANGGPNSQLKEVLQFVDDSLRKRVRIVHVEKLLNNLAAEQSVGGLGWYARILVEKYLPS